MNRYPGVAAAARLITQNTERIVVRRVVNDMKSPAPSNLSTGRPLACAATNWGWLAAVAWTRWLPLPDWSCHVETRPPEPTIPASALTHSFRPETSAGAGVVVSRNRAVATGLGLKPVR